jgi:hypothetical protein
VRRPRFLAEVPPTVRPGEQVPVTLRVTNPLARPLVLHLRGRAIVFDIVVADDAGETVWSRLHGQVTQAILRVEELAPGATLTFTDTWDQRSNAGVHVAPGEYTITGLLLTDDEPLTTPPATVRVRAPSAP